MIMHAADSSGSNCEVGMQVKLKLTRPALLLVDVRVLIWAVRQWNCPPAIWL
jgi:hypothetical protein